MVRAGSRWVPWLAVALAGVGVGCGGGGGARGASIVVIGGDAGGSIPHAGPGSGSTATGSDGASTGSATAGSSSSGTTGGGVPSPAGFLRPNAIYFGHWSDASSVSSTRPDGADRQDQGGLGGGVAAAVPDPDHAGKFIYAASVNGAYGLYRGSTFVPVDSETLADPVYDAVSMLQAGSDGAVAMVAVQNGASRLFLVANGAVRDVDEADGAALSPGGSRIAYTKPEGGGESLYVWDRATGAARRLVAEGDSLFPSFSKDGAWIVFSSNRDGTTDTPWDLDQVPTAGGAVERLTDTPGLSEFGACYDEDRTRIAYVGIGADPDQAGVYVRSNEGSTRIVADPDLNLATYWTDSLGRSLGTRPVRFQRLSLPR